MYMNWTGFSANPGEPGVICMRCCAQNISED